VGIVKNAGGGNSTGGLVETLSGPILPLSSTLVSFFGTGAGQKAFLSFITAYLASPVLSSWNTLDVQVKNFSFRGVSLSGIQQLASYMLADVIFRKDAGVDRVYVVDPGAIVGASQFNVIKSDIVSVSQVVDYSLDVASVLNPALASAQLDDAGDFVYDDKHAQKQPKFTVQAGAPGSQASADFIPIPDGWLVDGNYEEWVPGSQTDFTNPTPSVPNGRYWKVFQSPTNPGMLRGITNFTRLVKQISIPGNVAPFVGSPITGLTKQGTSKEFVFDSPGTESGIYGFTAGKVSLKDIVTGQALDIPNAIVLRPAGGVSSSDAASNFYSITMELWTFPKVNPQVFPEGGSSNPFNLPINVVVVNPNSNVVNLGGSSLSGYYSKYLSNYRLINSPRLRTTISLVYRNTLPQVGDHLLVTLFPGQTVPGLKFSLDCGRIQSVSLRFGRSGITLNIVAEKYQFGSGLYQQGSGIVG